MIGKQYFLFVMFFSLSTFIFSMTPFSSRNIGRLFLKKLPEVSGKMGAKIGEKVTWPIASRFLGVLSPYLLHIGTLGTMFRERIAQPGGKISLLGGTGSIIFFLFSLRRLKQKRHAFDVKIQKLKSRLLEINEEIETLSKSAKSAEPEQESTQTQLSALELEKKLRENTLENVIAKKNDRIKLFFKIASPLSKIMLFALYGSIAYGLGYSGELIEWIGERGTDPTWGGKFAPSEFMPK